MSERKWTGVTWRWECTEHGGMRKSTWNLVSSNGDVVVEGVKGVELVKNDPYTKLIRETPSVVDALASLHAALEKHANWDDGCFYYNGKSASELQEPLAKARAALQRAEGEGE